MENGVISEHPLGVFLKADYGFSAICRLHMRFTVKEVDILHLLFSNFHCH